MIECMTKEKKAERRWFLSKGREFSLSIKHNNSQGCRGHRVACARTQETADPMELELRARTCRRRADVKLPVRFDAKRMLHNTLL